LNAPPRSIRAPWERTDSGGGDDLLAGLHRARARGDDELVAPMVSSPTFTSVSSGFTSRLTSLNGWLTGMASATPGIIRNGSGSSAPLLPVMPTAVRVAPG
jgi:hypothetical protein